MPAVSFKVLLFYIKKIGVGGGKGVETSLLFMSVIRVRVRVKVGHVVLMFKGRLGRQG